MDHAVLVQGQKTEDHTQADPGLAISQFRGLLVDIEQQVAGKQKVERSKQGGQVVFLVEVQRPEINIIGIVGVQVVIGVSLTVRQTRYRESERRFFS